MNIDKNEAQSILRTPPKSIEAESCVLGGLMLDNHAFNNVGDLLQDSDFYAYEHRLIFAAITELVKSNKPADVITVFEHLQSQRKAEEVGGLAYLNSLAQYVPSASNIRRYAEIVKENSILRSLITVGDEISSSALAPRKPGSNIADILEKAEKKVLAIARQNASSSGDDLKSLDSLMNDFYEHLSAQEDGTLVDKSVLSGFVDVDRKTNGFSSGDLVIVAGRPSMGKTALAMNIAEHAAIKQDKTVVVFSLEMKGHQLITRLNSSVGRIDSQKFKDAKKLMTDEDWGRLSEAGEKLRNKSLHVQDVRCSNIGDLKSAARRALHQHKEIGLIVVDYIQLMTSGANEENRATELSQITRELKLLAGDLDCPIIALSQLNRSLESRTDKRPMMSDLRESGAIEQDADTIILVYRDEYYTKEACKEPGVAEIIIAKQRNGPTGTVKLAWSPSYTRFDSLAY